MSRIRKRAALAALAAAVLAVATGCSQSGGKNAEQNAGGGAAAGKANTPKMTIAMVTHGAPGDTFWDIIRKGATTAAAKDNVEFKYSADPSSGNQANLIPAPHRPKRGGYRGDTPGPAGDRAGDQEGDRRRHSGGGI